MKKNRRNDTCISIIRITSAVAESLGKSENLFWYTDSHIDNGEVVYKYYLIDNRKSKKKTYIFNTFNELENATKKIN